MDNRGACVAVNPATGEPVTEEQRIAGLDAHRAADAGTNFR